MVRITSTTCAAVLALVLHSRTINALFSVHEDLLAYPQYEVRFPDGADSFITEEEAEEKLAAMAVRLEQQIAALSSPSPESSSTSDLLPKNDINGNAGDDADPNIPRDAQGNPIEFIYESMLLNTKRYLCTIPIIQPPPKLNATERRKSRSEEEKELARATTNGVELLKGMEGNCLYFISGWWSYSFCYNDYIKQFHQLPPANGLSTMPPQEDPQAASYILGRSAVPDRDAKPDPKDGVMELQANGELKYLVQKLAGGTLCDITGKDRRIELQYHCAPGATQDRIGFIKEVTTCCYLMVVYTPRLCKDPAFQPPAESRSNTIECLEVMNEERIREYRAERSKKEANLQNLLEMVGLDLDGTGTKKNKKGKDAAAAAANILFGGDKPKYKVKGSSKGNKPGTGDNTYVIVDEHGREQVLLVQEMDIEDAMAGLPEGVPVIDVDNILGGNAQAGQGGGAGGAGRAGRAGGAAAGAGEHDEL